jgi:uncharacterized HAD superfamily protein
MRIAVDLDGVLADTMVTVANILNRTRSQKLNAESFDRWRAWEIAGITKDQFFRTLDEAWFSWESIPPTEEDLKVSVRRLMRFGIVDIVTRRSRATVPQANFWLERYGIPFDSFVRTSNSTNAKLALDYDLYVDDSAELMAILASRLHRSGILYLCPWNRNASEMPRIFRAERWDQIPGIVERIYDASAT